MLDANRLADDLINQLNIPEPARANIRLFCQVLIDHFKQHAEIDISNIRIKTENVEPGIATIDAIKQGKGRIE